MRIIKISATAAVTVPHPHVNYSNYRPEVTLEALLREGDDATACLKELQLQADAIVFEAATRFQISITNAATKQ